MYSYVFKIKSYSTLSGILNYEKDKEMSSGIHSLLHRIFIGKNY